MKILIFAKNWLGDTLFQFPAVDALHARYPDAEIVCLAPERCREIWAAHPAISRVIVFDEKKEHRFFLSRLLLALKLRKEKWDQAWLFHRSRTRAFLALLAGARARVGFTVKGKRWLTKPVQEPRQPMHQMDYFLYLLKEAGVPAGPNPAYRFYYSAASERKAEKLLEEHSLRTFACFHLGANWEPKRWPIAYFARLADLIHKEWGLPIVLTGSQADQPLAGELTGSVLQAKLISLLGATGLGDLGAIYKKACFVVSGDSGPLHIAAGVGTPVAAIFGPTDPKLTGPAGTGEKAVLHFIPAGYTVPWYGPMPSEGWLSYIKPQEVFNRIREANWIKACLSC